MLDFGIDKLALIGAVALVVIGPERLPRVAKTVGVLLGKAQRYVSQVQNEVNRSIELEEFKKMKAGLAGAARDIEQSVNDGLHETEQALSGQSNNTDGRSHDSHGIDLPYYGNGLLHKRKNWRLKRSVTPLWYKQRVGMKRHVQSGAARVARFRPPSSGTSL